MISEKLISILKNNTQLKDFIENFENIDILFKELNQDDMKRLSTEYPALIKLEDVKVVKSIFCITLIKNSSESKNYDKLKKIKIYFDILNEKVIKILKN